MVKSALIQQKCIEDKAHNLKNAISKIETAVDHGAKIICLQELFFWTFFPQHLDKKYYDIAEPVPGATIDELSKVAKANSVVLIAPIYEEDMRGVFYNTAVIINPDGTLVGKYRKNHIPYLEQFQEKFYFKPGNLGYPVFQTPWAKIGILICYDRHFPEGARALGLGGADIVYIPTATAGFTRYLWEVELRAHAIANGYFVGGVNRVGKEDDMLFYGSSFFCDPKGNILAQASDKDEALIVTDIDVGLIREVRKMWQFYRDRRPETYGALTRI